MLELSQILQSVFIFLMIILLTLVFLSRRLFSGISTKYLLFTGAGIIAVCLFFLESVISHYLLKFYHLTGWNGYFLYLFLLLVLLTPFVSALYKIFTGIQFKARTPLTALANTGIKKDIIAVKDVIPEHGIKHNSESGTSQQPELSPKKTEVTKDEIKKQAEVKKTTAVKKQSKTRKRVTSKKNTASTKKTSSMKNTGGDNAKN